MVNIKLTPYLSTSIHSFYNVPEKWLVDIKNLNFSELLSSSVSVLALVYSWNKKRKEDFVEVASGLLSSSFVYGDPVSAIISIASLAHVFETKNPNLIRKYKWSTVQGIAGVGAFALSVKLITVPVLNFLVGIIFAGLIRKAVRNLRLFDFIKYLKSIKIPVPYIKEQISRRDFLKLNILKFKTI